MWHTRDNLSEGVPGRHGIPPQHARATLLEMVGPVVVGVAGIAFAALALALAVKVISHDTAPYPPWILAVAQVIGMVFLGVGLFVWIRQHSWVRMGRLLVAVGVAWYVGDLQFSDNPLVFAAGFWLYHLNVVILAHLLLAYPDGQLWRREERISVALLYVTTLLTQGLRMASEHPLEPQGWGNPDAELSIWAPIGSVVAGLLGIVVVMLVVRRWRAASPLDRRAHALFWGAVTVLGIVVVVSIVAALVRAPVGVHGVLLVIYALGQLLLGAAVLTGMLRDRLAAHRQVARLIGELRQPRTAELGALREKLAAALEDPSLTLHYRRQNPDGTVEYVDLHGRPAPLPNDGHRAFSPVGPPEAPLAVLVHDPLLTRQPQWAEQLAAVRDIAGLALENASLHAAQHAHQRDVAEAAEATEQATLQRIHEKLHDGPKRRVSTLLLRVGTLEHEQRDTLLAAELSTLAEELEGLADDLREVDRGIYPATLRLGLRAALEPLAQRSPVLVNLDVPRRLRTGALEGTVYFLVSELVGNAQRHANATKIRIRVHDEDRHLIILVADNGNGGATPRPYDGGLRRWGDKAAALGGELHIDSSLGVGTSVRVVLPCA